MHDEREDPITEARRLQSIALLILTSLGLGVCVLTMFLQPSEQASLTGTESIAYRIDPNTADADTLCLLPRIGPPTAQRLINDRQANGPFKNASDMTRVKMIGNKTVAAFEPFIDIKPQHAYPGSTAIEAVD